MSAMQKVQLGTATLYQGDCMDLMATLADDAFELAIVDPPYGIDAANTFSGEKRKSGNGAAMKSAFDKKSWDLVTPDKHYFDNLFRVSHHQILWGANYMAEHISSSMGWIVWDKDNGTTKFSDCELAYTSFQVALRKFKFTWNGMVQGDMKNKEARIHPTQKPVKLYEWLLTNYAKQGDKILDTHLGSGSSAIAANKLGFAFVGIELDKDYFNAACKRIEKAISQQDMFAPTVAPAAKSQQGMFE